MKNQKVYFVGTSSEVAHQAASLKKRMPVEIVAPEAVVEQANPGDLAIFFSEHFDRFRSACQSLKEKHVATLYLVDGILEWRNAWDNRPDEPACPYTMRPVLSHKVACIGASQARVLESWGNHGKIEVVGIPRLDQLWSSDRTRHQSETFDILVMTAKTPGFTDAQTARVKRSLIDLKNWFDKNEVVDGRKVSVNWRLTASLDQAIGVENRLGGLTGEDLAMALSHAEAVISTPSTAMLEGMLMGHPVAALDYHNCPSYLQTAWTISSAETIEKVVNELANPPESKMHFQQSQLNDALYCDDALNWESATDRLTDLIERMLEQARVLLSSDLPLTFPEPLLKFPANNPASFRHAEMYPETPELCSDSTVELQAQLSHSRREIKHLRSEMAQLQSELDQAHEIFDSIQRHPIAGPIVRVRQKFLDWVSNFKARKKADRKQTDPADLSSNEISDLDVVAKSGEPFDVRSAAHDSSGATS